MLATTATVQSGAYTAALHSIGLRAFEKACPLLVPLVEEGWTSHPVTDQVIDIYLTEAFAAAPETSTLLLGCTHYPLIATAIHASAIRLGHPVEIVDSAFATALATSKLVDEKFLRTRSHPGMSVAHRFYATDSVEKFQRLGAGFLGKTIEHVELIDLGG